MKLKRVSSTPIFLDRQDNEFYQESGGMTKSSSSSKLKALVKSGKNALIKVLPKNNISSNGEKRDYDTDSSSQDNVPLPDYEGSTDGDSNSGRGEEDLMVACRPIPDDELPVATPIVLNETSIISSPKHSRHQMQKALSKIKVNVNSHRSRAFYEDAKNEKDNEEAPKEELLTEFPILSCRMSQFSSDVSGVSDNAVQLVKDPINMDSLKLVSKAALLKAIQVSGAIMDEGNALCATAYEKPMKEVTVPTINHAPVSIEQKQPPISKARKGDELKTSSITTQTAPETSLSAPFSPRREQDDFPDDEGPSKPFKKVSGTKKSRRSQHRNKEKVRRTEEVANPDTVNHNDDFFLMTMEDIQEISKMAQEYNKKTTAESGEDQGMFSCHHVQDAVEWLLCTSIQGGGRQTTTNKKSTTCFVDADMQDDLSSPFAATKFADGDRSVSSKESSARSYAEFALDEDENSVIQEKDDDSDSDSDSESDDGGDFYFDEQTKNTAMKVVRQFRPEGLICTNDLAVAYGDNLEQSGATIETVLIMDEMKYSNGTDEKQSESADCEYGDVELPVDYLPGFGQVEFNYNYQDYQAENGTTEGPMDLDAIVCENTEESDGWENMSTMTPHSAHTAHTPTSQHTAVQQRLQDLKKELAQVQKEYHEIANLHEETSVEQVQPDDSSIDAPLDEMIDAPHCGGDSMPLHSVELDNKLAAIKILQEEKNVLEKRVHELVSIMESSKLRHSKQMTEAKKASQARLEELKYQQNGGLEEATEKVRELESSLLQSQTKMVDMRAKYSRDLEAAKLLQSNGMQNILRQQETALENATFKIAELEANLKSAQKKLQALEEQHNCDLEAAERAHMMRSRERDLRENDLRSRVEDAEYKAMKDREQSDRLVREIREEHARQIEEMIQQLDVVVAEHEKEHVKEYEKLIAQLDLVVAEHKEKCDEMDKIAKEKDALIANLGSQLAAAQRRLVHIEQSS